MCTFTTTTHILCLSIASKVNVHIFPVHLQWRPSFCARFVVYITLALDMWPIWDGLLVLARRPQLSQINARHVWTKSAPQYVWCVLSCGHVVRDGASTRSRTDQRNPERRGSRSISVFCTNDFYLFGIINAARRSAEPRRVLVRAPMHCRRAIPIAKYTHGAHHRTTRAFSFSAYAQSSIHSIEMCALSRGPLLGGDQSLYYIYR